MATFLSPGVFQQEITLPALSNVSGPLRPAFVGTAKKGPMNTPTFVSNPQQYLDTFGDPFPQSYLGYCVLAELEDGNGVWVQRIGVTCEDGQPDALSDICIDVSGARGAGWGRVPVYTGIDYGRIDLRLIDDDHPATFHAASVSGIDYNDAEVSSTNGATTATLTITGTYTGSIDDTFLMVITSAPSLSSGEAIVGAEYEIIRNSDGELIASGTLEDIDNDDISEAITLDNGLTVRVVVTDGVLDENDTFSWTVAPNNRVFSVAVEGDASPTQYTMLATTYTSVGDFVDAANALLSGEDYLFVSYTTAAGDVIPQIRTTTAGERIQLMSTDGWALEVGTQRYAWNIPRSYLLGVDEGPFDLTSQNNRVVVNVIGTDDTETIAFNVASGLDQDATAVAAAVDLAGSVGGEDFFDAFALTVPGGADHVVLVASSDHQLDTLQLLADYSHLKTLRFSEELGIQYPYKRAYRGFWDSRATMPTAGESDAATPFSCESDPTSDECASDSAYFQNVVGWFVATTPGTWIDDFRLQLDVFTGSVGDAAGRYKLTVSNTDGVVQDTVEDISFDKREDRYIVNLVNPGTRFGGTSGNKWVNWEDRPAFLNNDPNADDFAVRLPSQFNGREFIGAANGIPQDASFSSELDAALIGNPATATGLYAFQNPESIDINLLAAPGFSTGAVIGTALGVAEARGDMVFLVDPPFGLRPQQTVDWHNGMLVSDVASAINSSYGGLYSGWVKVFDQFNRSEIWIPPSGHVAGVFSRTAREELWKAPAGLRRGRLLTVLDIEYAPTLPERDLLYGSGNAVNPIAKFPQDGIVVWGQRTLLRADDPTNRLNVRMLLIYIKKNSLRILRPFLFEQHNRATWRQAQSNMEDFLADIMARQGLDAFKVVVDETNNTPERVDGHQLWVTTFLRPTGVVEFIVQNLVVLRSGTSFASEEVLAAGGITTAAVAV